MLTCEDTISPDALASRVAALIDPGPCMSLGIIPYELADYEVLKCDQDLPLLDLLARCIDTSAPPTELGFNIIIVPDADFQDCTTRYGSLAEAVKACIYYDAINDRYAIRVVVGDVVTCSSDCDATPSLQERIMGSIALYGDGAAMVIGIPELTGYDPISCGDLPTLTWEAIAMRALHRGPTYWAWAVIG